MPAISGPFGPIVEPGWPAGTPRLGNLGDQFVNAWATGAAIRNQRSKLEEQMQIMALKERQMEYNEGRQEQLFELKKQSQDNLNSYRESLLGLRQDEEGRRVRALQDREQKVSDTESDNQGFSEYMLQKGLKPTDPEYPAALWAAKVLNPNSSVKIDSLIHNRNERLDTQRKLADAEINHYLGDEIGTQYFGDKSFADASIFLDPAKSERAFETEQSQADKDEKRTPQPRPKGLSDVTYKRNPDGSFVAADGGSGRIIRYMDKLTQQPKYAYFTGKQMQEIHDHLRGLYDAREKIPAHTDIGPDLTKGAVEVFTQKQRDHLPTGQLYYVTDPDGTIHGFTK